MKRMTIGLLLVALFLSNSWALYGYDVETHRAIARRAAEPTVSSLDSVLKMDLGFGEGIGQTFLGRNVRDLIGEGARFEDEPLPRVRNHFHNPLLPWDRAGLFGLFESSVLWGQNPNR